MLKLTYTDVGLALECIDASVETVVQSRTLLALRLGQSIYIQPGRASFLVPIEGFDLRKFKAMVQDQPNSAIELCKANRDCYELSLSGTWIASSSEADEGIFIATLSEAMEQYVDRLWQSVSAALSY